MTCSNVSVVEAINIVAEFKTYLSKYMSAKSKMEVVEVELDLALIAKLNVRAQQLSDLTGISVGIADLVSCILCYEVEDKLSVTGLEKNGARQKPEKKTSKK